MTPTIQADRLSKTYGDHTVVDGVSFEVRVGEIFGYLGRNGSGKTTTVRMLTTLTSPTSGTARVAGIDVITDPRAVRSHIGVTMQDAALDPQMSGREHLVFIAEVLGHTRPSANDRADGMLELFGLADAATQQSSTYSGGMKRRLDIATALLGEPDVLFLDEPTTGLDPQSRHAMWAEITRLKDRGTTIFLTTQYLEEADQLADHLAIIDRGKVIAHGTTAELKAAHARRHLSYNTASWVPPSGLPLDVEVTEANGRTTVAAPPDTTDAELLDMATAIAADGELAGLEIAATSLEDVFLRLTGSDINQTAASIEASA